MRKVNLDTFYFLINIFIIITPPKRAYILIALFIALKKKNGTGIPVWAETMLSILRLKSTRGNNFLMPEGNASSSNSECTFTLAPKAVQELSHLFSGLKKATAFSQL